MGSTKDELLQRKEKNAIRKAQRLAKAGISTASAANVEESSDNAQWIKKDTVDLLELGTEKNDKKNKKEEKEKKEKKKKKDEKKVKREFLGEQVMIEHDEDGQQMNRRDMSMSPAIKVCRFFLKNGSCSFPECKFLHATSAELDQMKIIGNEKSDICQMYSQTRSCKYGDTCIFKHIANNQPQSMSSSSTRRSRNPIPKIQETQKKRKANKSRSKHEAQVLKRTRGDDPIRERKIKQAQNLHLDEEAYKEKKRIKTDLVENFHCFRCNIEKISRNRYEWKTSTGPKTICNGCHGNLISKTK